MNEVNSLFLLGNNYRKLEKNIFFFNCKVHCTHFENEFSALLHFRYSSPKSFVFYNLIGLKLIVLLILACPSLLKFFIVY